MVLPPDSEVVANFSINGGQLGTCALVVVGHTLVDASMPSASILIINPNAEEVVLPCGSHIGNLVPVSAVSVARSELLKAKKCTFMQTEVAFLGHIVGRTGLACDPEKLSAVRNWHEPNRVKAVRQFVGFIGYYRRFVRNLAELADPLVALTQKGVPFVWGSEQQKAFDALKACLLSAPILGFPTEEDRFVLDTDASLFAIGGVLSQIQNEEEVVIAYASRSLRISQRRYCTTHVHTLSFVPTGKSIYPEDRPQLPPVVTKV